MSTPAPKIVEKFLTNGAYGYPQGAKRKHNPIVLLVLHISGNRRTAAANDTLGEIAYMNRKRVPDSRYNSAHNYIDRNGTVYSTVPLSHPAWNNGELDRPNEANPGVAALIAASRRGINPNELAYREIECTGYPGSFPITAQQLESVAWLLARDSLKVKLPINRNTVLTHADLDGKDRQNCPFPPGKREDLLNALMARARAIKAEMKDTDPEPVPEPTPPVDPCAEAKAALDTAEDRVDELAAFLAERDAQIAAMTPKVAYADAIAAVPRP